MKTRMLTVPALVLTAALTLTACGGGGQSSGGGGGQGSADSATLTYGIWDKNQARVMDTIVKDFNKKYPNIKVNVEVTPYTQYFTKLQTQASSGTQPDVFWMNGPNFELYASNKQLEPITPMVDAKQVDTANYPEALNELYSYDGTQYGVPKDFDTVALCYNKKIFDQAGEKYPTDDWTWDDFASTAKRISTTLKNKKIFGTAWELGDGQGSYYNTIPQAGGHVLADDKKSSGYDEPKTIEGLSLIADSMKNGSSPSIAQLTDTSGDKWFASGQAAMIYSESFQVPTYTESAHKSDFQVVRLPKKESNASVIHGLANVVSAKSQNKAAAENFVSYLSSKEAAETWAKSGFVIPAYNGTQEAWVKSHPEWNMQAFIDAAEEAVPFPASKNSGEWQKLEADKLGQLWAGNATAEQTGRDLAAAVDAVLAKESQ